MPDVVFVLAESEGGIGRHVRMLASAFGSVVVGPAATGLRFGFTTFTAAGGLVELRRVLRAMSPPIVHAHGMRAGARTVLAARTIRPRPQIIVTVHNGAPHPGVAHIGYRLIELVVARGADVVLTVSDDLAVHLRAMGARRVEHTVIAAPVQGSIGRPRSVDRPRVLAVGRLAPQKGFATLVSAAAGWRDLDVSVVIAGDGPLAGTLRRQASSLGVDVDFVGHRDDVPGLLATASVFVLPSAWEGQPLALQEALRAGVPVVASRVGGVPAVVGPSAALLVPAGDVAALDAAVRSVLTDPSLAARLRAAALARAATLPTESDTLAAAAAIYESLR